MTDRVICGPATRKEGRIMTKWIRALIGRSPQPPQAGDRPAGPYGLLQPGGCLVPVTYPQAEAERGDFEAGT